MARAIQFTLWCKHPGESDKQAWAEHYHQMTDDPQAWAEETLERFNASLRPGEQPRVLVRVEVAANKVTLRHDWEKINLVTEAGGYDRYRCTVCGATGKRHGLRPAVVPDRKRNGNLCRPPETAPAGTPLRLASQNVTVYFQRGVTPPKLPRRARVLVTGDRKWDDRDAIRRTFRRCRLRPPMKLIDGAALGADTQCYQRAKEAGLRTRRMPAEWTRYGKGAGPRRNLQMLDRHPRLVLAFHSDLARSKGTAHCVVEALRRGLPVYLTRRRRQHYQFGQLTLGA